MTKVWFGSIFVFVYPEPKEWCKIEIHVVFVTHFSVMLDSLRDTKIANNALH